MTRRTGTWTDKHGHTGDAFVCSDGRVKLCGGGGNTYRSVGDAESDGRTFQWDDPTAPPGPPRKLPTRPGWWTGKLRSDLAWGIVKVVVRNDGTLGGISWGCVASQWVEAPGWQWGDEIIINEDGTLPARCVELPDNEVTHVAFYKLWEAMPAPLMQSEWRKWRDGLNAFLRERAAATLGSDVDDDDLRQVVLKELSEWKDYESIVAERDTVQKQLDEERAKPPRVVLLPKWFETRHRLREAFWGENSPADYQVAQWDRVIDAVNAMLEEQAK